MSYTLRSTNRDGTKNATEITPEQALDLSAGKPIAYLPRDERILVDDDGTITTHDVALPQSTTSPRGNVAP